MKFIEKIKDWYKDCEYENLITPSNKFSKEADDIVSLFLKRDFTVVLDEAISTVYMFLISGDLILNVWVENRWYGFATKISLVKDIDIKKDNTAYGLGLRGIGYGGEVVFERDDVRLSRENFEAIKQIYLSNVKSPEPAVDFQKAIEALNGKSLI